MKVGAAPVPAPALRARDFGPEPALVWLDAAKVSVDPKYQRDTSSVRSRHLIDKIAALFTWKRFGVVLTVKHAGGWFVIDGQHRVEACRLLGINRIPSIVLPHASVAEAAADFVAINRDRVAVTPLHIHHAQLAAGDPEAVAIADVCRQAGVEICRWPVPSNKMKPGQTLAVQTVARLIKNGGAAWAVRVLAHVVREGGTLPGAVNAIAIREAAGRLFASARPANVAHGAGSGGRQKRLCLGCRTVFDSDGKHNRLCSNCKREGRA
jgi:hypothetical protein